MKEDNKKTLNHPPSSCISFFSLLLFFFFLSSHTNYVAASSSSFSPQVNYLIDCGSFNPTQLQDGRIFKSDRETASLLSTREDLSASVDSINTNNESPTSLPPSSSIPLYKSARIFQEQSKYTFYISKTGRFWIRLYFFPLHHPSYDLKSAVFSVHTNHFVLLNDFSVQNKETFVFKEYLINVSETRFSLKFIPCKGSFAFINAIEIVSAPDTLISDSATALSPSIGEFRGVLNSAFQVSYRVNVGGPIIAPESDTLSRTWEPDVPYNVFPNGSEDVSVSNKSINYLETGAATPLIAPRSVYSTAAQIKDPIPMQHRNFNLSWMMNVESSFSYLIRLHFCDIVSKSPSKLFINVYINGMLGVNALDLSSKTKALATAFYQDFVLNASAITKGSILIQVEPASMPNSSGNAILNGIEVMKISNCADSLDGFFSVNGDYQGPKSSKTDNRMKVAAIVALGLAVTAILLLVVLCVRWHKRPQGWEKYGNLSSWLVPCHSGCTTASCLSNGGSQSSGKFDSCRNKNGHSGRHRHSPRKGSKRFFHLNEMLQATHNFDENRVIGVGGFGKVYVGKLEDGTSVAIKRGSTSSEQGINEFRTELDLLSKVRHRHLVSLIGFCDENSEMILVYEYMGNGTFRSHLYGSNLPHLSWQQRLEICIGAARGMHYLHTGATQSIVHRDVKTTNILLDDNYVAKVADFGLSKTVQEKAQVTTAVKGSFGYLDPEYFRSQQLTQKSDIYSFGVVLVEALCARPVIWPTLAIEQVNLADWAMKQHRRGMIKEVIDPFIVETIKPQSLKTFVEAAEKCLADHGADRPNMSDVLWHLEYALQLQQALDKAQDESESLNSLKHHNENGLMKHNSDADDVSDDLSDDITDAGSAVFSQIACLKGR